MAGRMVLSCDTSDLSTYLDQSWVKVVDRGCSHIATNLGSHREQAQWVEYIHLLYSTYKVYMVVLL